MEEEAAMNAPELLAAIDTEKALTPEIDAKLQEFITAFKSRLKK